MPREPQWLPVVRHEADLRRFVLHQPGESGEAILRYEEQEEGDQLVFNMTSTEVPQSMEGRGMAASLVRTACEYARRNDVKIIPTCTFVQAYIESHPSEQDVLKQ